MADWLAYAEHLHPRVIALGLERVRAVAERMQLALPCPVITVAGTNGKGSTCALLEAILGAAGFRVGMYTSPHLVAFNERARVGGEPASDAELVPHFEAVERARGDIALTWFEFTTLAVLRLFQHARLNVAVLEVGLGGRLDAVNVIDADCAIVTCVALDHAEYLGTDRDTVGWEKAHVFRAGRPAICSDPVPPRRLIEHAEAIGADLWLFGRDFNYQGDRLQWSYAGRGLRRNAMAYPALRGANQLLNAAGALAALQAMRERLPVPQQAVRSGLATVELPGRFQVLAGRPVVVLDVAHNPHAAAHLARNLDSMGFFPCTYGVFGAMGDKDLDAIVAALGERIDHWLVVDLPGARAARAETLAAAIERAACGTGPERSIEKHRSPREALAAARSRAGQDDRIVAFGSFLTVGDILAATREAGEAGSDRPAAAAAGASDAR
ncbi:MAG: bifunctional tetrahydrofolate synthase/dihydrofolate synthase [Burkholderiales bacterium]|nr:MAG: bifunctional tetrahydrofolate synthase/dihydrofolate synthase [Burkholderiales bacterium]